MKHEREMKEDKDGKWGENKGKRSECATEQNMHGVIIRWWVIKVTQKETEVWKCCILMTDTTYNLHLFPIASCNEKLFPTCTQLIKHDAHQQNLVHPSVELPRVTAASPKWNAHLLFTSAGCQDGCDKLFCNRLTQVECKVSIFCSEL